MKNNITDMDELKVIDKVVTETSLPPIVGKAYFDDEITIEGIATLTEDITRFLGNEEIGTKIFEENWQGTGQTFYDNFIEETLKMCREELRSKQFQE